MLQKLLSIYKESGIKGIYQKIYHRLFRVNAKCYSNTKYLVMNCSGLEIGGPSGVFMKGGIYPIYPIIDQLDNCNFSATTTWEGTINEGLTFQYDSKHKSGRQFISDASNLPEIPASSYDFILSSHTIEHIANPIKALKQWINILKESGTLILLVPHKEGTFDHKRPVTKLDHLIDDYNNDTQEDDLTHLPEILELHDLERDFAAGSFENFKERSENNFENRCLHQHVFDAESVTQLLTHMNMKIHTIECLEPFHIIAIAQKTPQGTSPNNERFLDDKAIFKQESPFVSDRIH